MAKNIYNNNLQKCVNGTGFFRNGFCSTGPTDTGKHTVCAIVTDDFLNFNYKNGNNLIDPNPSSNFNGLKHGDKWCICQDVFYNSYKNGIKVDVIPEATNIAAVKYKNYIEGVTD